MNKQDKIGFIGCGNMSRAILNGLHTQGYKNLTASDVLPTALQSVKNIATTTLDNQSVISSAKFVVLSVKPQVAKDLIKNLKFNSDCVVISIMAGIKINQLKEWTNATKIVRVMPNLNAMVGCSYSGYSAVNLSNNELDAVKEILSSFGQCDQYEESMLNAVTGVGGSGPAYVFKFYKALLEKCLEEGLPYQNAINMCSSLLSGSAETLRQTLISHDDKTSLQVINQKVDSVCSKGGTTIEGVTHLDKNKFEDIVGDSVKKAIKRAEELSK